MAVVHVHALAPSENWDDDFEFNAHGRTNTNGTTTTHTANTNLLTTKNPYSHNYNDKNDNPNEHNSMHRISIASSDWDRDFEDNTTSVPLPSTSGTHTTNINHSHVNVTILEDKKNTIHLGLSPDWAEPSSSQPHVASGGPSTPRRAHQYTPYTLVQDDTENWDSDFEVDSPPRRLMSTREQDEEGSFPSPPRKDKNVTGSPSPGRTGRRKQQSLTLVKPRPESWDEEFEAEAAAAAASATAQGSPLGKHRRNRVVYSSDEEDMGKEADGDDEDGDFGYVERDEEDRTVTARSRRGLLRLSDAPPVPPLPLPFLLPSASASSPTSPTFSGSNIAPTQLPTAASPFPRSPTSSVFSVPTTLRPPSSFTVTSTTPLNGGYLGRTTSRASSGLSGLPPSPPIHRERERRRLRKKSRPSGPGGTVMEMAVLHSAPREPYQGYETGGETEDPDVEAEHLQSRPRTPPPVAPLPQSTPASPSTAGAILSRIGSVKKKLGGVGMGMVGRRRGASTGPGEVIRAELEPRALDAYPHLTIPRPHSQASTASILSSSGSSSHNHHHHHGRRHTEAPPPPLPNPPPAPPASGSNNSKRSSAIGGAANWFFRSTSSSSYATSNLINTNTSVKGSTSDLDLPHSSIARLPQTPTKSKDREKGGMVTTTVGESPAKLLKRKSLGFVQLRRGMGVDAVKGSEKEEKTDEGDDVVVYERRAPAVREDKEKEKEGTRTFMGSVRRISLGGIGPGGKHKRAQSVSNASPTASLPPTSPTAEPSSSLPAPALSPSTASRLRLGVGLREDTVTPTPKSIAAARALTRTSPEDVPPLPHGPHSHLNGGKTPTQTPRKSSGGMKTPRPREQVHAPVPLLPPIELQPPSPPHVPILRRPDTSPSDSVPDNIRGMLSPTSPISTSTVASTSTGTSTSSPATSSPVTPSPSPRYASSSSPNRRSPNGQVQAASLGRSTIAPELPGVKGLRNEGGVGRESQLRRSSLGDLKIPERISQAQVGLKKDMERVKEFAAGVEQLKDLQTTYDTLVSQVQGILDRQAQLHQQQQHQQQQQQQNSRPNTPSSFFAALPRPMSRNRSRSRSSTNPPPPSASVTSLAQTLVATGSSASVQVHDPGPGTTPQQAYKQLASAYYTIRSKYRISWECAELLIELGSGSGSGERGPPTSLSAPIVPSMESSRASSSKKGRERAITLSGGEDGLKPGAPLPGSVPAEGSSATGVTVPVGLAISPSETRPPPLGKGAGWRASTGKHDLSQRQLVLLREILNGNETLAASSTATEGEAAVIFEEAYTGAVNREWRWGRGTDVDAMASTLTLPSGEEYSSAADINDGDAAEVKQSKLLKKKRRASRLGMTGLRDMLRSLTRSQTQPQLVFQDNSATSPISPPVHSSTSLSTTDNSSMDSHRYPHPRLPSALPQAQIQGRRQAKTSSGPESVRVGQTKSPYSPSSLKGSKPSPRRPSLASIFRLGNKNKSPVSPELPPELRDSNGLYLERDRSASRQTSSSNGNSTGEDRDGEEDWDRMDDADDGEGVARASASPGYGGDNAATVRGKLLKGPHAHRSPYLQGAYTPSLPSLPGRQLTPKRSVSGSQTSLRNPGEGSAPPQRTTRLSNVEEHAHPDAAHVPPRTSSRGSYRLATIPQGVGKSGSVRSMPPQPIMSIGLDPAMLAMTPENIRPLLENAREVRERLRRCNDEMRKLMEGYLGA